MRTSEPTTRATTRRRRSVCPEAAGPAHTHDVLGRVRGVAGTVLLCVLAAASAIVTKEANSRAGLAALAAVTATASSSGDPVVHGAEPATPPVDGQIQGPIQAMREAAERQGMTLELVSDEAVVSEDSAEPVAEGDAAGDVFNPDTAIRYFNGRAVRPVRTITMLVTAYSPDERSCGDSADGITSSIHNVWTNGMNLVAADSRVLPLGSMVSIPGYDEGRIVPVLDRGGAIKGNRLDVLFSSHDTALRWGSRRLKITVWGPADGQPADDYRRFRDSRD